MPLQTTTVKTHVGAPGTGGQLAFTHKAEARDIADFLLGLGLTVYTDLF